MHAHAAAVLVIGDDPYLVSEAVAKALEGIDPLSVEELPAGAEDRAHILPALESTSLFGGRRAVVVRGLDEAPAEFQRQIVAYLKNPNPDCLLLLTAAKPLAPVAEAVRAVGHVAEAARGKRNDVFVWIREKARDLNLNIQSDAMNALLESVGEERLALAQALEELSLALGPGARVGAGDVTRQFAGRPKANSFGFLDATVTGQTGVALSALRVLLNQGEAPMALLGALTRHVHLLLEVGDGPPARATKELGLHPFRAEKLVKQAAGFSPPALGQALRAMAEADRRLKSGEASDELALERAVIDVAALRAASRRR